jgi:hypothetical protein
MFAQFDQSFNKFKETFIDVHVNYERIENEMKLMKEENKR